MNVIKKAIQWVSKLPLEAVLETSRVLKPAAALLANAMERRGLIGIPLLELAALFDGDVPSTTRIDCGVGK
eukprot:114026-Amphidinium_carterae.1